MPLIIFLLLLFKSTFNQAKAQEDPFTDGDHREEKIEIIHEIVNGYRDAIVNRYGYEVELKFNSSNIFQMVGGHDSQGNLIIEVYAGALKKFDRYAIVSAIYAARKAMNSMYNEFVDEQFARNEIYKKDKGIDYHYPHKSCRLLSMILGTLGEPRPKCWYNPILPQIFD